jgi:hypothetical protein
VRLGQSGQIRSGNSVLPLSGMSPEPLALPAGGLRGSLDPRAVGVAFAAGALGTAGLVAGAFSAAGRLPAESDSVGLGVDRCSAADGSAVACCAALAMRTLAESLSLSLVTVRSPR